MNKNKKIAIGAVAIAAVGATAIGTVTYSNTRNTNAASTVIEQTTESESVTVGVTDCDKVMYVTNSALNIRDNFSLSGNVLATATTGDVVTVIGTVDDSNWVKVRLSDGTEGYCTSDYLSDSKPEIATEAPTVAPTAAAPSDCAVSDCVVSNCDCTTNCDCKTDCAVQTTPSNCVSDCKASDCTSNCSSNCTSNCSSNGLGNVPVSSTPHNCPHGGGNGY